MVYDIAFVCGIYKSGTSLIVNSLQESGYQNPSIRNNAHEIGNGLTRKYFTNECIITREINSNILYRARLYRFEEILAPADIGQNNNSQLLNIIDYLSTLSSPTVLKDGQFSYTLQLWLQACNILGKGYKIFFSSRNDNQLNRAWYNAYYTKSVLLENPQLKDNMITMCKLQLHLCKTLKIPLSVIHYPV